MRRVAVARVGALLSSLALLALLPLGWFAVPRVIECGFGCYSPLSAADDPPEPVGPDVAPGTFHATTGWGSLPWPVVALVVLCVLGGVAVALAPRAGRLVAVAGAVALAAVALVAFVAQPGLDARHPITPAAGIPQAEVDAFVATLGPAPRLTDAMIDVRPPASVAVAALALLVVCALVAASGSRGVDPPRGAGRPAEPSRPGDLDSAT